MPDDPHEHLQQHDDILRRLTAMLAVQHDRNQAYDALLQAQQEFNARQVAINEDVRTTLARLETLLTRMLRTETNGHEA